MSEYKKSIVPGVILVLIGFLILVHKLGIYHIYWRDIYPLIFIGLGIWFFVNVFWRNQKGSAFPGTLFLLLGIFFILRNYYIFDYYYLDIGDYWPVFLMIFGLAFMVQFFFKPEDWGVLIPGTILFLLGFGFLARNMRWIMPFEIEFYIEQYWPLALIIIGIGIIISSLKRRSNTE